MREFGRIASGVSLEAGRSSSRIFIGLISSALVAGVVLRSLPLFSAFPVGDGGLFWVMSGELHANGFIPPPFTAYNDLGIPWVYPPLGLVVLAAFGASLDAMRVLPVVFAIATLPAVWLLARSLTNQRVAFIAAAAYALTPAAYDGLTSGGGVTRGPGLVLAVIAMWSVVAGRPVLGGVAGGATILVHPLAALYGGLGCLILWASRGADRRMLVALPIVAMLTAIWVIPIVSTHGVGPLAALVGARSGASPYAAALRFLVLLAYPPNLAFIGGTLGLVVATRQGRWDLVIWALVTVVGVGVVGRWGVIPFSILAGLAIDGLLRRPGLGARVLTAAAVALAVLSVIMAPPTPSLTLSEQNVMAWIKNNTPASASVAVIGYPAAGPVVEWFPALSERRNLTTAQGTEWLATDPASPAAVDCTELECLPHADYYVLRPGCCSVLENELSQISPGVYEMPRKN